MYWICKIAKNATLRALAEQDLKTTQQQYPRVQNAQNLISV
jgi:hypothetical protein